ncbi:virion major core protein P4b [Cetacean poxvirus 1]|nr:virion major core protein P4b [Cetacean poxvirus 1]
MEKYSNNFLLSKCMDNVYNNNVVCMIDGSHIHTPISSLACGVCNTLNTISSIDVVSAGTKNIKSTKQPNSRKRVNDSICITTNKDNAKRIPIDDVVNTHDWHYRLRKDGESIARYLIDNKCNISNFTIQDMLDIMNKLNIVRNGRDELFELLGHVKSSMSNSTISVKSTHPLVLIHSHAHSRIGEQIRELDKVYSPSKHQVLLTTTRYQSMNFTDISSSCDLLFCYKDQESSYFVHPIFMALFGIKLPALENTFIYGDTASLIQQLYNYRKVKPDNYMLLLNRLTEEAPIVITGIHDAISTEIQRANIHTMIRKMILNLRMGIFHCKDEESIDPYLMKIIHTNSSQVMNDEEQYLASILSIVGFRPTLVSVTKPGGNNYGMSLHTAPYVVVDPFKMITTSSSPISINSSNVCSLTFDGSMGRVVFAPPNISYRGQIGCNNNIDVFQQIPNNNFNNSPIIINGVLIFYVERKNATNSFGGECYTGYRSLINDVPIDVSTEIIVGGILYRLRSAVCYKIGDLLSECSSTSDIFLKGHYTILFTEMGPWMYDPLSIYSKSSRDTRLMRSLKNQYKREVDENADDSGFYEWLKTDGAAYASNKQQMLMRNTSTFEDDLLTVEEAMTLISRQCCILIYGQDYDAYVSSRNIMELLI